MFALVSEGRLPLPPSPPPKLNEEGLRWMEPSPGGWVTRPASFHLCQACRPVLRTSGCKLGGILDARPSSLSSWT